MILQSSLMSSDISDDRATPVVRSQEVDPVIRWVGGKSRIVDGVIASFPVSFGRYFEPFLGSAAVFLRLMPDRALLSDSCPDLISMYQALVSNPVAVHDALSGLVDWSRPRDDYYRIRAQRNSQSCGDPVRCAAVFLYLNKLSYNGLWRVNRRGDYNVPVGRLSSGKIPTCPSLDKLVSVSAVLRRADIRLVDYSDAVSVAKAGDLVYFDPPYWMAKNKSHTSYASSGFNFSDHEKLADCVRGLVMRGVHVRVSHAKNAKIRKLYHGMQARQILTHRSISASVESRMPVVEVVYVGTP